MLSGGKQTHIVLGLLHDNVLFGTKPCKSESLQCFLLLPKHLIFQEVSSPRIPLLCCTILLTDILPCLGKLLI